MTRALVGALTLAYPCDAADQSHASRPSASGALGGVLGYPPGMYQSSSTGPRGICSGHVSGSSGAGGGGQFSSQGASSQAPRYRSRNGSALGPSASISASQHGSRAEHYFLYDAAASSYALAPYPTLSPAEIGAYAFAPAFAMSNPSTQGFLSELSDSSGLATSQSSSTPSPRLLDVSPANPGGRDGLEISSANNPSRYHSANFSASDLDLHRNQPSPTLSASPPSAESLLGHEYGYNGTRQPRDSPSLPFPTFEVDRKITCEGKQVRPDIQASISKNVFYVENTWTCYRRNYISVECSYSLDPCIAGATLYLSSNDGEGSEPLKPTPIQALAITLSASADGKDGKAVELIQHTAKRDKGPQNSVKYEKLAPSPPTAARTYGVSPSPRPNLPFQNEDEHHTAGSVPPVSEPCQHTFERVQFKSATANNGRRRAAQQHYNLTVGLYADIRSPHEHSPRWVRIARKVSEQMVVRGRSPGHYTDSRQDSNGGTGAAGGGFADLPAYGLANSASMGRTSGLLHGSSSYAGGISGSHRPGHFSMTMPDLHGDSTVAMGRAPEGLKLEAFGDADNYSGYLYFPHTLPEQPLYHRRAPPLKSESASDGFQYMVGPPMANTNFAVNCAPTVWHPGSCGVLQGVESSRGLYPDVSASY